MSAALANTDAAEVVVVVDGSTDASMEVLRDLARDEPRLRPAPIERSGEAAARQHGAEVATGEVLLFLDDDVVASPSLARGHAAHHATGEGLVVVGYMPVSERARRAQATARVYGRDYEHQCQRYHVDPGTVLLELWAGNCSIRRQDCLAVGVVSPSAPFRQFRQHVDREFGIRCHEHGLVGIFDRSLLAEHEYQRTVAQFLRLAEEQAWATRALSALHPELLEPWDPQHYEAALPSPLRRLTATRPRARAVELGALTATMAIARRLGWHRLEDRALTGERAIVQIAAVSDTGADSRVLLQQWG